MKNATATRTLQKWADNPQVVRKVLLAALIVVLMFAAGHKATRVSSFALASCTWNNTTGNWNDASRWSCGSVPGPSDTAIISAGTVTVTSDVTISGLQLSSATLTLNANLTVTGEMSWNSGTINGNANSKLTNNGTLTMSGSGQKFLIVPLLNLGTLTWSDGQLVLSSTVTNQAGATLDFQGSGPLSGEGLATIVNAGTLSKNTASTLLFAGIALNNSGSINVNSGALHLNGGTSNSGSYNVGLGATLGFVNGNHTILPNGSINGLGLIQITGGTTTLTSDLTVSSPIQLSSATLTLNANLTVTGEMSWNSGTINGNANSKLTNNGTLTMSGSGQKFLNVPLLNLGTLTWSDGQFVLSSTLTNQAGATLNFQGSGPLSGEGVATIVNAGTLSKNTASTLLFAGIALNNSGSINVNSGALDLIGGSSNSGSYNVALGATLGFVNGNHAILPNGSINGPGLIQSSGSTLFNGLFNATGAVRISGGSATFNSNVNVNQLSFEGGSLLGNGAVAIVTSMDWSGGTISRTGVTTLQPTCALNITGTNFKFLESTLTNNGTANYSGAHLQINSGGVFTNGLTGTFNLDTDNPLEGAGSIQNAGVFLRNGGAASIVRPQFTNAGTLEITSTNLSFRDFFDQPQTLNQTSGTTRLSDATLTANLTLNGGTLTGTGTIDGSVTNAGLIAPGLTAVPAGMITVTRNYTQTAVGSLNVELGGSNPGVDSDLLVTNTTTSTTTNLAGTINVSLISGFHPADNSSFQVARYATHIGSFGITNGLDMGAGLLLDADYRNTELVLVGGSGGPPVPWVQVIVDQPTIRANEGSPYTLDYRVVIGNSGGEASTVVVAVEIESEDSSRPIEKDDIEDLISTAPIVPVDDPDDDFSQIPKKVLKDNGTTLIPFIMHLPPGSKFTLKGGFRTRCRSAMPNPPTELPTGKQRARIFGHAISAPSQECLQDLLKFLLGFLPGKGCVADVLKFFTKQGAQLAAGIPVSAASYLVSVAILAAKCGLDFLPAKKVIERALELYKLWANTRNAVDALFSCAGSIFPDPEKSELSGEGSSHCVVSKDPNDKLGPVGVGTSRFISGAQALSYAVFFENVPTASAPAQVVKITDQLDPSLWNLNTFALGDIGFADKNVVPAPNSNSLRRDVDLRPQKNLIVRVEANLNVSTGLVTWLFTSIDPATGLPLPPSSTDGFLDPNVLPPQGEGLVMFSVTPKTGLPSGTVIKNKATIVFDQNTALITPEWSNTIDNSKPSSSVHPLSSPQCSSFPVQWSGNDDTSGVAQFSVFVSKDGAPYEPWLLHTSKTSDFFSGVAGSSYSFYSVARDGAGNVEAVPTQPDATTNVTTSITIASEGQSFTSQGGTGSVAVRGGGCQWIAESRSPFITVTVGASGSGDGSVNYSVASNTTNSERDGEILVAGHSYIVYQSATGTLTPATIQFDESTIQVDENHNLLVSAIRTGDTSVPLSVSLKTSSLAGSQACTVVNGAASSRCDYESSFSTIQFAPKESFKTSHVLVIDDSYLEGPETFSVTLSNPSGAILGTTATTSVSIIDNELVTGPNPIVNVPFFVRAHYLDFFTREPDSSGLAFWTNEITSCAANQQCAEIKRINVSAAFYLSIEFQQTGYLVERLYKTAFGDASATSTLGGPHQLSVPIIRLDEFLADAQRIGSGVVVGEPGWEQLLENNKATFTNEFVQRSRFTSAFPLSLTPAQFVDQLNINAGNPLSVSERNQLVAELTAGTKTRAQVLRAVADDADLNRTEFNRAFVLMQYFGYLRRNPNETPDSDYTGYDFWLTKLNQFNGNFVNAEMVKAFIDSTEYNRRFGP